MEAMNGETVTGKKVNGEGTEITYYTDYPPTMGCTVMQSKLVYSTDTGVISASMYGYVTERIDEKASKHRLQNRLKAITNSERQLTLVANGSKVRNKELYTVSAEYYARPVNFNDEMADMVLTEMTHVILNDKSDYVLLKSKK